MRAAVYQSMTEGIGMRMLSPLQLEGKQHLVRYLFGRAAFSCPTNEVLMIARHTYELVFPAR